MPIVPQMLIRGLLLATYWAWFVANVFAVPAISPFQAIGISMTVGLLTPIPKVDTDKETTFADVVGKEIGIFVYYALALGIGYAWHKAMS